MLPLLKAADLDGALLVAMQRVDANATADHAATLNRARTINAVIGLVVGPLALVLLIAWPVLHWLRFGRDPHYLDDASILMPAPPPDLTAAAGALVFDGRSSRHTLTTAMLDLASRDEIAFRPEVHRLAKDRMGIEVHDPNEDNPQVALNRRKPISPAEIYARTSLAGLAERRTSRGVRWWTRRSCWSSARRCPDSTRSSSSTPRTRAGSARRPRAR